MRTNRELALAVKRALATGAVLLCGAGGMAAQAQQAAATQPATTQAPAAKANTTKPSTAKPATTKAPVVLAQATTPQSTPPQSLANNSAQLQTVVITGSLIERTSVETPNPVQVLSSKDLVQSGYTDISDVLRSIPANGANTLSQSFSFAFATGASGISLRGLTLGDTLVLIDSERSVPYPLLDDNQRSFVDLSSIPFTAIQQVQILKDGGSALYGSDAIAGVVNVILRKEYQGFHVTAESGTSSHWDGTTEHVGFIGGVGDLASDGYNWYLSGDFRHQDAILASSRSGQWDSFDFTGYGGYDREPGINPAENPLIPYPQSLTGYLINPNTATGTPYYYFPGCDPTSQVENKCAFTYPGSQLQPADTNVDLLGKFTKELGGGWEFGLQASWFDSKSEQVASYNNDLSPSGGGGYGTGGITNIGLAPGGLPNVISYPPITVPPGYLGSNFTSPAALIYNFPEIGPQNTQVDTYTDRLLASLTGSAAGWDIKGTIGAMYAKMDLQNYGFIEPGALQNAINNGYVLGSPNGASLFAPVAQTTPTSQLDLVDIHGTRDLFHMPGGPLSLAVGVQWYKEEHDETPPPAVESGVQEGDSIYIVGTEYDRAAFVELDGKPIKQLEIDLQGRYDNYQTFGSDTTPKIGLKFTPVKWVSLRGTWGKGFRAPSAAEGISSGETFGAGTYDDTTLCPTASPGTNLTGAGDFPSQCLLPLTGVDVANAHLKDVTSTNWTTGIIVQPLQQLSATVDYYNIKVNNDIISSFEAGGFANYTALLRGPQAVLPYCPPTASAGCNTVTGAGLVNQLTPVGLIVEATYPYVNASSTQTSGYDVDLQYHWDMGAVGRFTGEASWTHLLTYQVALAGTTYELAGTHGPSGISGDTGNPKDRFNVRLSWNKGPITITPSVNFIGHFSIVDPSSGYPTCASVLGYGSNFPTPTGAVPADQQQFCNDKYFLETDVYAEYQLSAHFEVHASVTNVFNKQPPVDVVTYGSGSMFYPYDAAMHQDGAVGRFMLVGLSYDF